MKSIISIACLLLVAAVIAEARPKRSVLYAAAPAVGVASVPVVQTASVVHDHPTTVVKTQQINDPYHGSSYSQSTEVKSNPHVHTHHTVAAAPVVASAAVAAPVAAVSTVHHTVPTYSYHYPGYYTGAYYSGYPYYSYPYSSYVVGK